jgi:hypothetical protein
MIVITIEHFEVFDYYYIFDALIGETFVDKADFVRLRPRLYFGPELIHPEEFFIFITIAASIRVRSLTWRVIIIKCPALI